MRLLVAIARRWLKPLRKTCLRWRPCSASWCAKWLEKVGISTISSACVLKAFRMPSKRPWEAVRDAVEAVRCGNSSARCLPMCDAFQVQRSRGGRPAAGKPAASESCQRSTPDHRPFADRPITKIPEQRQVVWLSGHRGSAESRVQRVAHPGSHRVFARVSQREEQAAFLGIRRMRSPSLRFLRDGSASSQRFAPFAPQGAYTPFPPISRALLNFVRQKNGASGWHRGHAFA